MIELKPCPHCGRRHPFERHQDGSLYSIRCGCGASVEAGDPGDAEIIWNCRETDRMVELLRKQLADMDALNAKLNRGICDLAGRNEQLEEELAKHQESEFHPDWSQLQAAREALREHQSQIKKAERLLEALKRLAQSDCARNCQKGIFENKRYHTKRCKEARAALAEYSKQEE
jgi:ABC-type phosphate transport system auxiliary subunit